MESNEAINSFKWSPNTSYKIVLFYIYTRLEDSETLIELFKRECKNRFLLGRILVASEGINGTLGGSHAAIDDFVRQISEDRRLSKIDWKYSYGNGVELPFVDLFIKHTKELISSGNAYDTIGNQVQFDQNTFGGLSGTGVHLAPEEFHTAIYNNSTPNQKKVIIDVRNEMEYAIGHFQGALGLGTHTYAESWTKLDDIINEYGLVSVAENGNGDGIGEEVREEKQVFMYCTGGIRCEKASAYMKAKGVKSVFQLQGGIHRYLEAYPNGGSFLGKNFVFDGRVAVAPDAAQSPSPTATTTAVVAVDQEDDKDDEVTTHIAIVGRCQDCECPYDIYCGNRVCTVCRTPLLLCDECLGRVRFPEELHCVRHRHLKDVYFTVLERFPVVELHQQAETLLAMESGLKGNTRRTLRKQRLRILARIEILEKSMRESESGLIPAELLIIPSNPQLRCKEFGGI
eukprot:gene2900-5690_t